MNANVQAAPQKNYVFRRASNLRQVKIATGRMESALNPIDRSAICEDGNFRSGYTIAK